MPTITPNHSLFNLLNSDNESLWLAEATFWKFGGLQLWPTGCALLHYFELMVIDIRCKQREQAYHGTVCIGYLSGQACTRWLWLFTKGQCWGAQGLQRISFLIVVVHYAVWQQEVSYCALREVDGATLIPYLYRKAIGAYSGMMWIFQDLLPSEVKVQWLHASMVPRRRLQSGFCIEVLYRVGLANPFRIAHMTKIFYLYIMYAFVIVLIFMPQKWCKWCWRK